MVAETELRSTALDSERERGFALTFTRAALTALAYFVTGRLALLMAIPPGYSTSVWPAAGVALAAVLVWGKRVAPGVAVGSFAVNVTTGFDATDSVALASSLALPLTLGLGAMLQAFVGASLVRQSVGYPAPLEDEPRITRFMVLGGPVACLVSPTVGVTTLALAERLPWSAYAFNWWTWWVGDAIGVLLFAPLVLLLAPTSGQRRGRAIVALPLLGSFAMVTTLFVQASSWEEDRLRADFERRAVYFTHALESTLSEHQQAVSFVAGLFYASSDVTETEFREFAGRALVRYEGIEALAWLPYVREPVREPPAARAHAARADTARAETPGGVAAARLASASTLTHSLTDAPAFYFQKRPGAAAPLDWRHLPEAQWRPALERAKRSGAPSATPPIVLPGDASDERAVLLFVPVFAGGPGAPDVSAALRGYAAGVFRLHDVVRSALEPFDARSVGIAFGEAEEDGIGHGLYESSGASELDGERPSRTYAAPLRFGGRDYRLEVTSECRGAAQSWQAWLVLAAGLFFARIMGMVTLMTTGRVSRAQRSLEQAQRAAQADEKFRLELEACVRTRTAQLSATLREREVLLQEVHHRVKNNLQVISSLINMQRRKLAQGSEHDALGDCQTRIHAIALIHESLYQSSDYAQIPFSAYAKNLTENVLSLAGAEPEAVKLELDLAEVSLGLDKAIPCGLILNELLCNALKHAFPDGRRGTLHVALRPLDHERLSLVVQDDGVGMPPELEAAKARTLGLSLVHTLARQLRADLAVARSPGTRFELSFTREACPG